MSYRSILVNLDIDAPSAAIVKLAMDLARRFDARIIGLSAADVPLPVTTPEGMVFGVEHLQLERQQIEKRLGEVRLEFEKLVGAVVETEWREAVQNPTRFLLESARAADLVVTTGQAGNVFRSVDIGSLALGAGRPVLIAAGDAEHVLAKNILVAWKDPREARRAVVDALPFLATSTETIVATIDRDPDRNIRDSVNDVVAFLRRHGVTARAEVVADAEDGERLLELAHSAHADLIVSGAYGHSRAREWAFGGMTRTLLDETNIHRFMSC
jgi:nucleotide-binding universal stress UspA family protein